LELLVIPLACGMWIDLCGLHLWDSTLGGRMEWFLFAPW